LSEEYSVSSLTELLELTRKLIPKFPKGEIIGLTGELGAGKTAFVQSVCSNLGLTQPIVSPTYSIENRYQCFDGTIIHHLDLYRLNPDADAEFILEILGQKERLIFIEWPERVLQVLENVHTFVNVTALENGSRNIEILQKRA
jgi:tRNA threonylcarbamoyladenosine biosynthesis protein TsaE